MGKQRLAPFRTIIIWPLGILGLVLVAFMTILIGFFDTSQDYAHKCACLWGKFIIWLSGVKVVVHGIQHLDPVNPQILAANHQGSFDIWALSAVLPIQFRWVVKKELFKLPFMGGAMRAAGYVAVDRFNPRQAIKDIKQCRVRLEQGRSILIFPEGTRTLDGHVGDFKPGAFLLASQSKLPVVPISIQGSYQIMPKDSIWLAPQTIFVNIFPPIPTHELTREEQKKLSEKVRHIINEEVERGFVQKR